MEVMTLFPVLLLPLQLLLLKLLRVQSQLLLLPYSATEKHTLTRCIRVGVFSKLKELAKTETADWAYSSNCFLNVGKKKKRRR